MRREFGVHGDQGSQSSQGRVPERNEQHTRRERDLEIYRSSLVSLELTVDQCMYVRKLPKAKERTIQKN